MLQTQSNVQMHKKKRSESWLSEVESWGGGYRKGELDEGSKKVYKPPVMKNPQSLLGVILVQSAESLTILVFVSQRT